MIAARIKDALLTAIVAGVLALPLAGIRTSEGMNGLNVSWHLALVAEAMGVVFAGRLLLMYGLDWRAARWQKAKSALTYLRRSHFTLDRLAIVLLLLVMAIVAGVLALPLAGIRTSETMDGLNISWHLLLVAEAMGVVFAGHLLLMYGLDWRAARRQKAKPASTHLRRSHFTLDRLAVVLLLLALVFPLTPLASRYVLDVAIMVLTYIMMAWGLNITVGYAGLLDLGYAGFYALGAYCYALLAQNAGFGFWTALPIAGLLAAVTAFLLGLPVLRLRGDYFAVVTLGFGEIVRLVIINWTKLTNGPNGISGVPRPQLFNLEFVRQASESHVPFHEYFGLTFDPIQRMMFLYYIILCLAVLVGLIAAKLRRLPIGRAWEAFREDEIACASLGVNRWGIKLAAYSLGALVAGLAGAFFGARQGFISPESFTFSESATILAITVLGGVGHPLGIVFAAALIIGMPELFRDLEQYRMLAFGAGMVLIMIGRPGGLISERVPSIRLEKAV